MFKKLPVDLVLFCLVPLAGFGIARNLYYIPDDFCKVMFTAILSAGIGFLVGFSLFGDYSSAPFKTRLRVFSTIYLFTSAYWIVLAATDISDGYGQGNIFTMLFGVSIAVAIAWRQITKSGLAGHET